MNDKVVFKSTPEQENFRTFTIFELPLTEKENILTISSEKTTLGFGLILGNLMPQWEPTHFECTVGNLWALLLSTFSSGLRIG